MRWSCASFFFSRRSATSDPTAKTYGKKDSRATPITCPSQKAGSAPHTASSIPRSRCLTARTTRTTGVCGLRPASRSNATSRSGPRAWFSEKATASDSTCSRAMAWDRPFIMARIEPTPALTDDFDRIFNHLLAQEAKDAASRVREVISAIDVLEQNPLIGPHFGSYSAACSHEGISRLPCNTRQTSTWSSRSI